MPLKYSLLVVLPTIFCASAQTWWNATVGFFPESDEASCEAHNIANAIKFSSGDGPETAVCFNLHDLFGQQLNYTVPKFVGQTGLSKMVNYTLTNVDSYNPNTNYTRVWFDLKSLNGSPMAEGGGWSPWTLNFFSAPDCLGFTDSAGPSLFAEASCRTKDGGECEKLSRPVQSFKIFTNSLALQQGGGKTPKCETWKVSDASVIDRQTSMVATVAVVVAALMAM